MLEIIQKIKNSVSKNIRKSDGKGQSLVEMALIAPILLILFIGVFEVGWAIRGYLVLANTNRETVRYSVKNGVLNFSVKDPTTVGYDVVLSHTVNSLSKQLPLDFDVSANNTLILSHFVIDTGFPCVKYSGGKPVRDINTASYVFNPTCNCSETNPASAQWFTGDDLIAHPGDPLYPHYTITYGISRTTRLGKGNYSDLAKELALENNQFNCNVLKNGGSAADLSTNNLIIAEAFYEQPQLLGVPFISNKLTDPIPFYTHTAMRIVTSRDANSSDTVGPTCELFPITFPEGDLFNPNPGSVPPEQSIDAYEGGTSGGFGWLYWNSSPSATNGINYIEESLINPRLSMTDYVAHPSDPQSPDTSISLNDIMAGRTGVGVSGEVDAYLSNIVGKTVLVPIYSSVTGSGNNAAYKISHFARIRINQICLPSFNCTDPLTGQKISGSNKLIRATFLGYEDDACGPPDFP